MRNGNECRISSALKNHPIIANKRLTTFDKCSIYFPIRYRRTSISAEFISLAKRVYIVDNT